MMRTKFAPNLVSQTTLRLGQQHQPTQRPKGVWPWGHGLPKELEVKLPQGLLKPNGAVTSNKAVSPDSQDPQQDPQNPFKPFDREAFLKRLEGLKATPDQVAAFDQQHTELGLPRAADNLIASLSAVYGRARALNESRDPKAPLELTKLLGDGSVLEVVKQHARVHLSRMLIDADDPEAAIEILTEYFDHLNLTPMDERAAYYYAEALAGFPGARTLSRLLRVSSAVFPTPPSVMSIGPSNESPTLKPQGTARWINWLTR